MLLTDFITTKYIPWHLNKLRKGQHVETRIQRYVVPFVHGLAFEQVQRKAVVAMVLDHRAAYTTREMDGNGADPSRDAVRGRPFRPRALIHQHPLLAHL